MKNLLVLSVFILLFNSSAKAQDSLRYNELHAIAGANTIGINVLNHIAHNFDLPDMGIAIPIGGVGFSYGKKKYAFEWSFSGGGKEKSTKNIQFMADYSSFTYAYKYCFINKNKFELRGLANFNLQFLSVQIDSIKRISSLLNFSSNNFSKKYIALGPGIETVYGIKTQNFSIFYGLRASYNFYLSESKWEKTYKKEFSGFSDSDPGNLEVSAFIGYRFSYRYKGKI